MNESEYVEAPIEGPVFKRLQSHSIPLTDTVSSVITRLLDFYEANQENGGGSAAPADNSVIECNPASPPNLRHTVPDTVVVDGVELPYSMRYWNNLMIEVIRLASKKVSQEKIFELVIVNKVKGSKTGNNFNYIEEAGLSVQLQNAVAAWRATHHIASKVGISVEVFFHWNVKDNAAHPGKNGHLKI